MMGERSFGQSENTDIFGEQIEGLPTAKRRRAGWSVDNRPTVKQLINGSISGAIMF
jgi:hypothetical protein